jgi:hypothetical protein
VLFAIRDDDTNFFTQPAELAAIYSGVWDECPISLAITPFQAGYPKWLPGPAPNLAEEFPLEGNQELVEFLRDGCARGRFSIMLHGYNHNIPSGQPEFQAGERLAEKARKGKEYLEGVLGTKITCFVPPHNALSREGIEAVVNAGMNIVGIQSFRPNRRVLKIRHFLPFLIRNWHLRVLRAEYPRPLWVLDHWEIPYCVLGKVSSPKFLREGLERAIRLKGSFCLSTHYWEFGYQMVHSPTQTVGEIFLELLKLARRAQNVTFTTVNHLPGKYRHGTKSQLLLD